LRLDDQGLEKIVEHFQDSLKLKTHNKRLSKRFVFFVCLISTPLMGSESPMTPSEVLGEVYAQNPELLSKRARANAEDAAISMHYSLSNPRIGWMREQNTTLMQQQSGAMNSWRVSQEILFPAKYFALGSMQHAKANTAHEGYLDTKLQIRQKALSHFYKLYADTQIRNLLEAQKETLREIARIAESRRATGSVPQQDEMKAHVEQTKIENELILQTQTIIESQALLNALINREPTHKIMPIPMDLEIPAIKFPDDPISTLAAKNSKQVSQAQFEVQEAKISQTLANLSYLPDFVMSYQRPFGSNAPPNAFSVGIEITIPLWFFSNQMSQAQTAFYKVMETERRLESIRRETESGTTQLASKVETLNKLLKIYDTALIPQSVSTLNSSRTAYSAGRVGFQELLDAERSLYGFRIERFRHLAALVENLTMLERVTGISLSDLPMDGGTRETNHDD
jgi:outer membrane protein TolC